MIRKSLPNLFTVGNLFLGIAAIILVFNENDNTYLASIMVIIAMLLDGLDGRVARALNAQSEFGKELDSLSDVISFGVAPAFIMYKVAFFDMNPAMAWIVTAIFPICGALRLARFNVTSASTPGYFIGLPIPAAAGVLCALALFHTDIHPYVLLVSTVVLSYLMVSRTRYPNFKKFGIPRSAIWVTPFIIVIAVWLGISFHNQLYKFIFVPLVLYALYGTFAGIKKNARRIPRFRRKHASAEKPVKSKTKR